MTVLHLLPTVLVAEAPPRSGLGPLGVLDCDSGLRLADLDPHNAHLDGETFEREAKARTLSLFDRVNLLPAWPGHARPDVTRPPDVARPHLAPSAADRAARGAGRGDAWPKEQAAAAWRDLAPSLAGRRVALVGRTAEAAGLRGLPPLRWLRLGGEGEPAEACLLPHPSGVNRWYNDGANRATVGAWIAQERKKREDAEAAWVAIGGGWAYHLARGEWGMVVTDPGQPGPKFAWAGSEVRHAEAIRDRLLAAACGIRRFGGFGALTILDHCLLAAGLCSTPGAKRLALAHDLHETPLVGDASSPLKRIMRSEWRPVEQVAARAVERLLGLDPTPEERAEVAAADRLALLVEARQVGVDLGDPTAEFGQELVDEATDRANDAARGGHATPADWLRAWRNAGS